MIFCTWTIALRNRPALAKRIVPYRMNDLTPVDNGIKDGIVYYRFFSRPSVVRKPKWCRCLGGSGTRTGRA